VRDFLIDYCLLASFFLYAFEMPYSSELFMRLAIFLIKKEKQ